MLPERMFLLILLVLGVVVIASGTFAPTKIVTKNTNKEFKKEEIVMALVRQSARWATAAKQDENPMIAVLHANYGAGYLWALRDIVMDSEIEQIADIDIKEFTKEIVQTQDKATRKAIAVCPDFGPAQSYLTKIAGEGN